jgi:hypothetical protein
MHEQAGALEQLVSQFRLAEDGQRRRVAAPGTAVLLNGPA